MKTYEESILEAAERNGWEVYPDADGGGVSLIDQDGNEAHHAFGGDAERRYDFRMAEGDTEPGRWVAPPVAIDAASGMPKTRQGGVVWRPWGVKTS